MGIALILILLFAHWFCDFLLQTDWMASNKNKSILALLTHTLVYSTSITFIIQALIEFNLFGAQDWHSTLYFGVFMFVTHTIIDFVTSKITKKLWEQKKIRKFFDTIGIDQFLHYTTIFVAINYLFL